MIGRTLQTQGEEIVPEHDSFSAESSKKPKKPKIQPVSCATFTNKGGVGKTTATYNFAASLVKQGLKVLLVDADAQCNLSASFLRAVIDDNPEFSKHHDREDYDAITRRVIRYFLRGDFYQDTGRSPDGLSKEALEIAHAIYKKLISCELFTEDQSLEILESDHHNGYFLLTQENDESDKKTWGLYLLIQGEKREIYLFDDDEDQGIKNQIPGLLNYLEALGNILAKNLTQEHRLKIQERLRSYRLSNFLQAALPWADGNTQKEDIDLLAMRLSLSSLKPKEKTESTGELLLLPGSYSLFLQLGRTCTSAIRGIKEKTGEARAYVANIYGFNELIRKLASLHNADLIMLDLAPNADDLNAILVGACSDYLITAVTPEPFSDDAMINFRDILDKWAQDFADIYASQNSHKTKCRLISQPAKVLGYVLQKVSSNGGKESEFVLTMRTDIERIFRDKVVPLIQLPTINMYPDNGIQGIDTPGGELYLKRPRILRFRDTEKEDQKQGIPIVWSQRAGGKFVSGFKEAVDRLFAPMITHDDRFRPEIQAVISRHSLTQHRIQAEFGHEWAQKVLSYYHTHNTHSLERRSEALASEYYRPDLIDMALQIYILKSRLNDSWSPYATNKHCALLLDPCTPDQLSGMLSDYLKQIETNWGEALNLLLIPLIIDTQWMCIRVEVLHHFGPKKSLRFLIDDPRGYDLEDDYKKAPQAIEAKLIINTTEVIYHQLTSYFRGIFQNHGIYGRHKHWQFNNQGELLFKRLDQQGALKNDTDSGIIVISNLYDYFEHAASRNDEFDHTARKYIFKSIQEEASERLAIDPPEEYLASQSDSLYTIKAYRSGSSRNRKYRNKTISSAKVVDQRNKFVSALTDALSDDTGRGQLEYLAAALENRNKFILYSYRDYVETQLSRIDEDFRSACTTLLSEHEQDPYFPSEMISVIRFRAFNSGDRTTEYKEKEEFAERAVDATLKVYDQPGLNPAATHKRKAPATLLSPMRSPIEKRVRRKDSGSSHFITFNDVQVNTVYWYEDPEMYRILRNKLNERNFKTPDHKDIFIDRTLCSLDEELLEEHLDRLDRRPGITLIPYNLGNNHWVGLLIEYNARRELCRAEYYDSLGNAAPKFLTAALKRHTRSGDSADEFTAEVPAIKQNNGHDCGPCTIANLLAAAGYPEDPGITPAQRRFNHLACLRNNPDRSSQVVYESFNKRQCGNRSSSEEFLPRKRIKYAKGLLSTGTKGSLSIEECSSLWQIAFDIKSISTQYGNDLIEALSPIENADPSEQLHLQLTQIREAFKTLAENSKEIHSTPTVAKAIKTMMSYFFGLSDEDQLDSASIKISIDQIPSLAKLCEQSIAILERDKKKFSIKIDEDKAKIQPMEVTESSNDDKEETDREICSHQALHSAGTFASTQRAARRSLSTNQHSATEHQRSLSPMLE